MLGIAVVDFILLLKNRISEYTWGNKNEIRIGGKSTQNPF
jgi:hypothetical protein